MKNKSEADFYLDSQVPGESRITDNPQCIRKQQYCCDTIDNVCAYARASYRRRWYMLNSNQQFLNGINCQAAKPGKKVQEPAAAESTPADGPPPPPPLAGDPSENIGNELVAPDPNPFQDSVPPASGDNSWSLLEILPVLTDFWPDWERFPLWANKIFLFVLVRERVRCEWSYILIQIQYKMKGRALFNSILESGPPTSKNDIT